MKRIIAFLFSNQMDINHKAGTDLREEVMRNNQLDIHALIGQRR